MNSRSSPQNPTQIYIGTAAWSIPVDARPHFSPDGSHLERYAERFNCVEINSSFYHEHKAATYARWYETVPAEFKFSVKLSQTFTHERKLKDSGVDLEVSLKAIMTLGEKLGLVLIQLPASLEFSLSSARNFFSVIRAQYQGSIALEPRNLTWTRPNALELLSSFRVSKVQADPEPCPLQKSKRAQVEKDVRYLRLHGTPARYKSSYEPGRLMRIAASLSLNAENVRETWCIFDNTAYGHATSNALNLQAMMSTKNQLVANAIPKSLERSL